MGNEKCNLLFLTTSQKVIWIGCCVMNVVQEREWEQRPRLRRVDTSDILRWREDYEQKWQARDEILIIWTSRATRRERVVESQLLTTGSDYQLFSLSLSFSLSSEEMRGRENEWNEDAHSPEKTRSALALFHLETFTLWKARLFRSLPKPSQHVSLSPTTTDIILCSCSFDFLCTQFSNRK